MSIRKISEIEYPVVSRDDRRTSAGIWLKFLPRGQAAFKVSNPLRLLTVVSWKSYRGEVAGIRGELLAERSMTIMSHGHAGGALGVGTHFRRRGPVRLG